MKLNDLETLIPQYAMNKAELDEYKKICDKENEEIKRIMRGFVVSNYTTGGYKATYTISERTSINEEMLLDILDRSNARELGIIKTKDYVDYDALENAIYNNLISKDIILEMDKAKETKEVQTLKVTKVKKEA